MTEKIFHITNRGVEKRKIFLDKEDYARFVDNLRDFNDIDNAVESHSRRIEEALSDVRRPTEQIVDVLAWCLMPNHIHVLVNERVAGGASLFSKKLVGGYTKYFNFKNKRSGVLFQGRSKIIDVRNDDHFIHLPYYIFANPIKLLEPDWKERGIKDTKQVFDFLINYKWSSFPSMFTDSSDLIIDKKSFFALFDANEKLLKRHFTEWLSSASDVSDVARPTK